jgi:hypothetical protein
MNFGLGCVWCGLPESYHSITLEGKAHQYASPIDRQPAPVGKPENRKARREKRKARE